MRLRPTPQNRLRRLSQVQIDKAISVKRDKVGATTGRLDGETLLAVTRSLALILGLA